MAEQRLADFPIPAQHWVVENVVGALRYFHPIFGPPRHMQRPYFLWGSFPPLGQPRIGTRKHKQSYNSARRAERAQIPYAISESLAIAIESQMVLI